MRREGGRHIVTLSEARSDLQLLFYGVPATATVTGGRVLGEDKGLRLAPTASEVVVEMGE